MIKRSKFYIGVAGGGVCSAEIYDLARQVGYKLAQKGLTIICGGRGGVMEATARGAKEGGGVTVGVLPSLDYADLNPYIDYPLLTGLGQGRNLII
ncbi:MAG: hypothetical protein GX335_06650, partial [Firmicutes bacterium]|nr:hypothetical protein [Bacillota bacterium]